MTNSLPVPPLLVITDPPASTRSIEDIVQEVLGAGCRWIMYREKEAPTDKFGRTAENLSELCRTFDAILSINGDIEIAQKCDAGGVHLQSARDVGRARSVLKSNSIIGVSCHGITEAQQAGQAGADYVTLSPVFETISKSGYGPTIGLKGLSEAEKSLSVPVVALAGISSDNAAACLESGAQGVAVMGGVMRSQNPGKTTEELISAIGY